MGLISLSQVPLKMSWNLTLHPAPGTLDFDTTFHSFREQTRHCGGKGTGGRRRVSWGPLRPGLQGAGAARRGRQLLAQVAATSPPFPEGLSGV